MSSTPQGQQTRSFWPTPGATLLLTTQALIGEGEKSGRLKGGVTTRLGDTVAGLAAPPGSPKPDISTSEKFKAALLAARRIAFSDPARGATVGTHFMKVIESLGIKDEVLKKATLAQDGVETMRLVLDGKVDLGVTQSSEVLQANRAALVGPFPKEFDLATTFSLWHRADLSPPPETLWCGLPARRAGRPLRKRASVRQQLSKSRRRLAPSRSPMALPATVIVGAGAAGIVASIFASERSLVTLIERTNDGGREDPDQRWRPVQHSPAALDPTDSSPNLLLTCSAGCCERGRLSRSANSLNASVGVPLALRKKRASCFLSQAARGTCATD